MGGVCRLQEKYRQAEQFCLRALGIERDSKQLAEALRQSREGSEPDLVELRQ